MQSCSICAMEKEKTNVKKGVELLVSRINDPNTPLHKQIMTDVLQKRKIIFIYPNTHFWDKIKPSYKYWKYAFKHQDYTNELLDLASLPKNITARLTKHCVEIFNNNF